MNVERETLGPATYYYESVRSAGRISLALMLVALIGLATAASASAYTSFKSPSGNIGCAISKSSIRCDIGSHSFKAPPKPAGCDLDWGGAIGLGKHGKAHFLCVGDTTLGAGKVLPYEASIKRGRFHCESQEAGMRCTNLRSGHGFFLSNQSAQRF